MTLPAQVRKGAAAPHFIAYISGMPWAIATSQAVIDALAADTVTRRQIFGAARSLQAPHPAGDTWPADTLPIFLGLEPPGEQTTKLDQDQSWVDCGKWSLVISRRDYGVTWPLLTTAVHARRNEIRGLEGVHAIADHRYSMNVLSGTLDQTIEQPALINGEAVTSIYIRDCERLAARITADVGNGECTWIWCGTEAMAAYGITDEGDGVYMIGVTRGILRTRPHAHFVGDWEGSAPIVTDAPLGGVSHRPVALYALTLDATGAVEDWYRVRHGVVSTSIKSSKGMTTISCNGWTDSLKANLPVRTARGQLRGYNISRPTTDLFNGYYNNVYGQYCGSYVGGFRLMRYSNTTGLWTSYDVWFTTAGTNEFFEDWAAIRDRINEELAECSDQAGTPAYGSDMLPIPVVLNDYGLTIDPSETDQHFWMVYGELAILLRLGIWILNDADGMIKKITDGLTASAYNALYCCGTDGAPFNTFSDWAVEPPNVLEPERYRSKYISMSEFSGVVVGSPSTLWDFNFYLNGYPFLGREWPPAAGSLYMSLDFPATTFTASDRITVGDKNRLTSFGTKMQFLGTVDSIDGANNRVILDDPPDGWQNDNSLTAAIRQVDSENVVDFSSSMLAYIPAVHGDSDPWPVEVSTSVEYEVASQAFADILGDQTGDNLIPGVYRFDSIADAIDRIITIGAVDYYDQRASIDWQALADSIYPISEEVPETYSLKLSNGQSASDVNPYNMLRGLLMSHGVSPTWEPDALARTELMRFRATGMVNVTAAMLEGRTATESEISDFDHTENHTMVPAYQRARVSLCNDGNEYKLTFSVFDRNASGISANRGKELSIEDRLTQLGLGDNQADKLAAIGALSRAIVESSVRPRTLPEPTVQFRTTSKRWFDFGVGRELLITDRSMSDPYTGILSLSGKASLITAISRDLGSKDFALDIDAIVAARPTYGWAPVMYVEVGNSAVTGADTVQITPNDRDFSNPDGVRTDLSWFDCYLYSLAIGQLIPSGCACGDYGVRAVERYTRTPTLFAGLTIESVDVVAGTATLRAVNLGVAWGAAGGAALPWIIRYESWDNALIQPCQRFFCCGADDDGLLIDSAAAETNGHTWG